ncbi:hypothetical protein DNO10_26550 [Escherichia coli]|nr:hypothetical protein [Escherichia coli]
MNTFSDSRLALALAFGVTLTACSSTPPDQRPSDQTAPESWYALHLECPPGRQQSQVAQAG